MNNKIMTQVSVQEIIVSLNQKNRVPVEAINAACAYDRDVIVPALLAVVKNAVENYQSLEGDDTDYLPAMYRSRTLNVD